jgi:hypothetical protein
MRLYAYNAGTLVQALDAGPDGVTFAGLLSGPRATLTEFGTLAAMPGDSNYATLHATGVTRTNTNYALRLADSGSDTLVNAATTVALAIAGTAKLGVTTSSVNLGSGVALSLNGTTVIDASRNATFASVTTGTLTLSDFGKLTALVGDSNYAAIYGTGVTPSGSNYVLRFADDGGSTVLNAAVFTELTISGTTKVRIDTSDLRLASGVGIRMDAITVIDSGRNGSFVGLVATGNPVFGTGTASASVSINGDAGGSAVAGVNLQNAGVARASMQVFAGTAWRVVARNTSGVEIDSPFYVDLAVGGKLTLGGTARTTNFKGALEIGAVTVVDSSRNANFASITATTCSGIGTRPVVARPAGNLEPQDAATFRGTIAALASADPNFTGILYQDGFQRIASDGTGWFQYLNSSALVGSTIRPLVVRTDGLFVDQDAATFRTTIGVLPYATITGTVDFNSLNSGTVGNYRVQGSSYTNAPPGASSSVTYDLWQGNAGGRLVQRVTDTWWGGAYHRFQIGANSNAWSPWLDIWDSGLLPTTTLTRSFLAASTTSAARAAINAASNPEKTTKNGSWNLDASTPLCVVQTATGTLTLPAASSTYQCKSYVITASTTVTLTIAGSYCYLDANNSASYWYDTTSSVPFLMNGGHVSGSRKMIEIWCDGAEWYVRC